MNSSKLINSVVYLLIIFNSAIITLANDETYGAEQVFSTKNFIYSVKTTNDDLMYVLESSGVVDVLDISKNYTLKEKYTKLGDNVVDMDVYDGPDGRYLILGFTWLPFIKIYDIKKKEFIGSLPKLNFHVLKVYEKKLFVGSLGLQIYDIQNIRDVKLIQELKEDPRMPVFSILADEKYVIFGGNFSKINIYSAQDYRLLHSLNVDGYIDMNNNMVLKDNYLFSSHSDCNCIRMWDIERGESVRVLKGNGISVTSLATDNFLVSGNAKGDIKMWDIDLLADASDDTTQPAFRLRMKKTPVKVLYFNEEKQLITVYDHKSIVIWSKKSMDMESDLLTPVSCGNGTVSNDVLLNVKTMLSDLRVQINSKIDKFEEEVNKYLDQTSD